MRLRRTVLNGFRLPSLRDCAGMTVGGVFWVWERTVVLGWCGGTGSGLPPAIGLELFLILVFCGDSQGD